MKAITIATLLLTASAGGQPVAHSGVRDPFRRVVQRAALAILRSDSDTFETTLDARKAIDEVTIEANSSEEESVIRLLSEYQLAIVANNSTISLLDSQVKLEALRNGFDTEAPYYKAYLADRDEIHKREVACSDAIGDMVRHKLNTDLPSCDRAILKTVELKTKIKKE